MSPFGTVTGSIQGSLCSGYRTAHCRQFAVPSCRKVSTHYVLPRTYSTIPCSMRAGMTKATYGQRGGCGRSEEHTSELQSLMRISYAVFCLKKKNNKTQQKKNKNIY